MLALVGSRGAAIVNATSIILSVTLGSAIVVWGGVHLYARSSVADLDQISNLLAWLNPLVCGATFAAVAGLMLARRDDVRWIRGLLSRWQWFAIALILVVAVVMRIALVPASERLYYDEHTYLDIARGIVDEGRARVAVVGIIEDGRYRCEVCSYPHWPAAWPTLVAAGSTVGGELRDWARALSLLLSLGGTLLVACIAAALFSGAHALLAAAAYASLPANVAWSRSGASEGLAVFGALLAVFVAVRLAERPHPALAWLLAAVLTVAALVRNEGFLIVGVCLVFLVARGGWGVLPTVLLPGAVMTVVLIPHALHLGVIAHGYDPAMPGEVGMGLAHFAGNLASLRSYLSGEPVTAVGLGLAAYGLLAATPARSAIPLGAWILLTLFPPLFYFAGSYTLPGGDRFALAWLAPVALGMSAGLMRLRCAVALGGRFSLTVAVAGVYCATLIWAARHTANQDLVTEVPRADTAFLRAALTAIPRDAVVLTAIPAVALAEGRSAAMAAWVACEPGYLDALASRAGGRLFFFVAPSLSAGGSQEGGECEARLIARAEPVAEAETSAGLKVLYQVRSEDVR